MLTGSLQGWAAAIRSGVGDAGEVAEFSFDGDSVERGEQCRKVL